MINKFSNDDFLVATYRLASENNFMLKMVLENQLAIMKEMKIQTPVHQEIMVDVLPGYKPPIPDPKLRDLLKTAQLFSERSDVQMWEYAFDVKRIREDIAKDPNMGLGDKIL